MGKREFEIFGLRRNALVVTVTSIFLGSGRLMVAAFFNQYALYLGASMVSLGLFSLVQGLVKVILVVPLSYLSDKIGHRRKWILVTGDVLSILAYLTYIMAGGLNNWLWLIPGLVFEAGFPLTSPVGTAIVSDYTNPEKRGMAMGARAVSTSVPNSFAPFLAGVLLDSMGMSLGMPVVLIIAALFRVMGTLGRAIFIKEEKRQVQRNEEASAETVTARVRRVGYDMFEPFFSTRTLRLMVVISCIAAIGTTVSARFLAVFAQTVIGLTNTEWGLILGVGAALGAVLRIPIGKLTDIFGRRKCILVDYAVRPIFFVAITSAKSFTEVLLLSTLHDLSGEAGLPAWQALIVDITPRGKRGRVQGTFNMFSSLMEVIFPSVAAFLWQAYGAMWAFYLSALAEVVALSVIFLFLPEPKRREM